MKILENIILLYNKKMNPKKYAKNKGVKIGENSRFIGARSTILPGVTIGPNSVVAAGSVVVKDVLPNSVFGGVPAKFICSIDEYAEKCFKNTPLYDVESYKKDKKKEVLRILD